VPCRHRQRQRSSSSSSRAAVRTAALGDAAAAAAVGATPWHQALGWVTQRSCSSVFSLISPRFQQGTESLSAAIPCHMCMSVSCLALLCCVQTRIRCFQGQHTQRLSSQASESLHHTVPAHDVL
jgi:hypothetical protein